MIDPPPVLARRGRLLAMGWAALLGAILLAGPLAADVAAADPASTPAVVTYRMSLLASGDFTRQYTRYQCVGASLQIMRNMIRTTDNRTRTLQRRLWNLARANSRYTADGGADPYGWAMATSLAGHGRYVLVAAPTMSDALRAAAKGMATTGRPAGLVVWHGTHAWVMTGFEATADPRTTDDFQVLGVRIADPLWPYRRVGSHRIYRPGSLFHLATLGRNYTVYHDARRDGRIEGRFVAIVPLEDDAVLPPGAWDPISIVAPSSQPQPTDRPAAAPRPTPTPSPVPSPTVVAP